MKKQDFFALFVLLAGTALFYVLSYVWREQYGGFPHYHRFRWNLFLAWIPVGIAFVIRVTRMPFLLGFPFMGLWMLFFPNALYLLTDLEHIQYPHFWFKWAIVVSYVLTGVFAGFVSLAWIQSFVRATLGSVLSWLFVVVAIALSGLGVYIGRFWRWNSWDMLTDPRIKFWEFRQLIKEPDTLIHMIQVSGAFSAIFLFVYLISMTVPYLMTTEPKG